MRGRLVIEQELDLGGGAHCIVTDTSPEMDIDPATSGPAVLADEAGMSDICRAPDVAGMPAWTGLGNNGRAVQARWEAV